tara:strand:- start:977 stop:1774 length:798 start_codon:yes stop_codon:yes gene_type:complete
MAFQLNDGFISRAKALAPSNTINSLPIWEFMNQTGTLGTFLAGSVVYVGTSNNQDVQVIVAGTLGAVNTVIGEQIATAGSAYVAGNNINATNGSGSGLTVDITVPLPTANLTAAGTGYSAGAVNSVTGGTGTGILGTVAVNAGNVTSFTFTDGGSGYTVGDVLTLQQAASGNNATVTLTAAPNGAVTAAVINAGGEGYKVGDVVTVNQAGSNTDCTLTITAVESLLPTAADAVVFKNAPQGQILPVLVDYVLAANTTASNLLVAR